MEMEPPIDEKEPQAHGKADLTDCADDRIDATNRLASDLEPPNDISPFTRSANQQSQRPHLILFSAFTAASIGGMGVATFGLLASGKVGLGLTKSVFEVASFGAMDIIVRVNLSLQEDHLWLPASASDLQKRGCCWFAIGILQGSVSALANISIDKKREGTIWQPAPIACKFVYYAIFRVGLTGVWSRDVAGASRQPTEYAQVVCDHQFFVRACKYRCLYTLSADLGIWQHPRFVLGYV